MSYPLNPRYLTVAIALVVAPLATVHAEDPDPLYYDRALNSGWMGGSSWSETSGGPYNTGWVDGSLAVIRVGTQSPNGLTIDLDQNITAYGIIRSSTSGDIISKSDTPTTPVTITLQGGPVSGGQSGSNIDRGSLQFSSGVTLTGDFTLTNGTLGLGGDSGTYAAHAGAITVDGTGTPLAPQLSITSVGRTSAASTLTVDSGIVLVRATDNPFGAVSLTNGSMQLGHTGAAGDMAFAIGSLSGDADSEIRPWYDGSYSTSRQHTMMITQSNNGNFAGTLSGFRQSGGVGAAVITYTKNGGGDLILSGDVLDMRRTFAVNDGGLFVNGSTTEFGDTVNGIAIAVASGATLGGSGTIATQNNASVVLASGASLVAGTRNVADRTAYTLGASGDLDLTSVAGEAGWLRFDLGSSGAAGDTYSQILVTSGTVLIGNGDLGFADFDFNLLAGFGIGLYELFDTAGISGSLSGDVAGMLNGYDANLYIDGDSLYLQVIPEPGTATLLFALATLGLLLARRRQRNG